MAKKSFMDAISGPNQQPGGVPSPLPPMTNPVPDEPDAASGGSFQCPTCGAKCKVVAAEPAMGAEATPPAMPGMPPAAGAAPSGKPTLGSRY